jgi:hypothetical protein
MLLRLLWIGERMQLVPGVGRDALRFDGEYALPTIERYHEAIQETGMSEKPPSERIEAVQETGPHRKRADGWDFEDHIEIIG